MDRFQIENAVHKIDGYFFPKPEQHLGCKGGLEAAFIAAKTECIDHLQQQIDNIKFLTYEQFAIEKKLK